MKIVLLLLVLFMFGCASRPALKLTVDKTTGPDAKSEVLLETDYELENGGSVTYNAETKTYEIDLASATTKDTEQGVWILIAKMLEMMQAYMVPIGGAQ